MADPQIVSPVIDDGFWFAYSKEIIEKSLGSRNDQAAKLQSLIAWLWGIYTAGAALGLGLGKANSPLLTALIALPSLILIFAYWSAVDAQSPVDVEFDPRSPTEIKQAYILAVDHKKKQFAKARRWSMAAGIFVAIALFAGSFGKPSANPELGAARKGDSVTVWGRGIASEVVSISIFPRDSEANIIKTATAPCSPRGDFATQFELKSQTKNLVAKIEWTDAKKLTHTIARTVE